MRKRLFAVAATALLPALGLLAYNELSNRRQRNTEVHLQASQGALHAASETERVLEGAKSLLVAVSALPPVVDLDPSTCSVSLQRISDSLEMTGSILVIDAERKLVCDSNGNPAGIDFSERSYVNDGLAGDTMVVGDYTISKLTGAAVLPVAVPLKRNGQTIGVVATAVKLDWLQARMLERELPGGGSVTLTDRQGVILAHVPFDQKLAGAKLGEPLISLVTSKRPGTIDAKGVDGAEQIIAYRPVNPSLPVFVSVGVSRSEAFRSINRTTWTGVAMLILSMGAAFVAASYVGNRFILRPIHRIVTVLEAYKAGNRSPRTNMQGESGELGLVADTVDDLLNELEARRFAAAQAEERRALLVGELRHRVKNTLAVVTAIARQTFPRDERLDSFSQRLSALGRAYDLILTGEEGCPGATISDVVKAALAPHENSTGSPFRLTGPGLPIAPEAGLALSLIIHELATNATKYGSLSRDTGSVLISWTGESGRVSFTWSEQGGPLVSEPERVGFGSQLIRRAFPARYHPELTLNFAPDGLRFTILFDADMDPAEVIADNASS